jgi:hypothetical protein
MSSPRVTTPLNVSYDLLKAHILFKLGNAYLEATIDGIVNQFRMRAH